ncbi:MAG: hypothetical protein ACTHKZ_07535 [Lysobacteraceae bacterium]
MGDPDAACRHVPAAGATGPSPPQPRGGGDRAGDLLDGHVLAFAAPTNG